MVFMPLSLRTQKAPRSECSEPIRRMFGLLVFGGLDLENIGDAELGLAAADQRDQHGFAGGRLHHDVQAGLSPSAPWRPPSAEVWLSVPGCMVAKP